MSYKRSFLILILLSLTGVSVAAELLESTNIGQQVQAFFTDFSESDEAKKLSEEDWAIFEKDKKELAEKMPDPGLHIGDKAPNFTLNNAFGKPVRLSSLYKDGYPFEVVSDSDYAVLKSYNLYFEVPKYLSDLYIQKFGLDIAEYNGEGRYGLPVPATYIIDKGGVIRAAQANTDYTIRMEPADILEALKAL